MCLGEAESSSVGRYAGLPAETTRGGWETEKWNWGSDFFTQ